jgi:hypothetical protein
MKLYFVFHCSQWKRFLELREISIAKIEEKVVAYISDVIPCVCNLATFKLVLWDVITLDTRG